MRPDPYAWSLHPEASLAVVGLVAAYVLATRRYPASRGRRAAFAAGALLLLATAVTPLDPLSYHLLTAHLLQNVVLAEWAPALLVLGVPPTLAAALTRARVARALTTPAVALTLWLATYFAWHVPWLYDTALEHTALLHLEHASYVAAGLLLWWPVLQEAPHALAPGARATYLFVAFVLVSPLGLLLALLPEPVYEFYDDAGLWGLSPLTDQQIAGVTMAGEEAIVFFAAFTFYFLRFLRDEEGTKPLDSTAARRG